MKYLKIIQKTLGLHENPTPLVLQNAITKIASSYDSKILNRLVLLHARGFISEKKTLWQQSGRLIMNLLKAGAIPLTTPKDIASWSFLPIQAFQLMAKNGWNGLWPDTTFRHIPITNYLSISLFSDGNKPDGIRENDYLDMTLFKKLLLSDIFPLAGWNYKNKNNESAIAFALTDNLTFIQKILNEDEILNKATKRFSPTSVLDFPEKLLPHISKSDDIILLQEIFILASKYADLDECTTSAINKKTAEILQQGIHNNYKARSAL